MSPHWTERAAKQWTQVQVREPVNGVGVVAKGTWIGEKLENWVWTWQLTSCGVLVNWPYFTEPLVSSAKRDDPRPWSQASKYNTCGLHHEHSVNAPVWWCLIWPLWDSPISPLFTPLLAHCTPTTPASSLFFHHAVYSSLSPDVCLDDSPQTFSWLKFGPPSLLIAKAGIRWTLSMLLNKWMDRWWMGGRVDGSFVDSGWSWNWSQMTEPPGSRLRSFQRSAPLWAWQTLSSAGCPGSCRQPTSS